MRKKQEVVRIVDEDIFTQALDDLMGDRFAIFAKYVIQDRAIPDAKDGLKPAQRRILFSMYKNKNFYEFQHRKCAKIVGDVIGNYHPHGDTSVYEALVRMSQKWKMNAPLIDFQGNNGSIDGDSAAAYRYTEAKLSKFATLFIEYLEKNCVEYTLNFSDELLEPVVLPAFIPNLFINGSEGIAVGLATKIPPHNLVEMCKAVIYRIENPNSTLDDVLQIVKGPDLPTGGIIYDNGGLRDIYEKGHGKFEISSKYTIKEEKDCYEVTIYEIPYGVLKQDLVYTIDKIQKFKEIDGIIEVKDLSTGENIDIKILIKKDSNPEVIMKYLLNKTQLKVNFSANIVAICDKHPKTLPLIDYLDFYINFYKDMNIKILNFDKDKKSQYLHIVDGLIKAYNVIDDVVHIIRNSANKEDAKNNLISKYSFSEIQANSILDMKLYKLTHTDINVYINEKNELESDLKDINELLTNQNKFKKYIISFLNKIVKEFNIERRTLIENKIDNIVIDKRELISKENFYVVLTKDGYIKKSSIKSYKACDGQLPGLKSGDDLILCSICNSLDYILAFTNLGNYLYIPVYEVTENKWKDEGKHINYMINLPLNEYLIKACLVKDFSKDCSIAIISKNGFIKKTELKKFQPIRYNKTICCMKLSPQDEVADVQILNNNSNLLIICENGYATYFNEKFISETNLKSAGVKAISTLRNSKLKSILALDDNRKKLFILTNKGMYRIYDTSYLNLTDRLGATQTIFKSFKSDCHSLVYISEIKDKNESLLINGRYSNDEIFNFVFNDFHLTPIDKYCKLNIEGFNEKLTIKSIFNYSPLVIDENTIVNKKEDLILTNVPIKNNNSNDEIQNNENKKEEDDYYEEISLFDDMGD